MPMSLLEMKDHPPFDLPAFQSMMSTAQDALKNIVPRPFTQVIVLRTAKGNDYRTVIPDVTSDENTAERDLVGRLTANGDTEVRRILCMWHDGNLDLPSYDFRRMLYEADPNNADAHIFVMTTDGASAIELARTLAKKHRSV